MTLVAAASPFLIISLPRSRSAWLSYFLTYGDWQCLHDEARHWRGLDDVRVAATLPMTGFVETSISSFWRLIPRLSPSCRVVIIHRRSTEVLSSLASLGCEGERVTRWIIGQERKLVQATRRLSNPLMVIDYAALAAEATCRAIFEFCLSIPHDHFWWLGCNATNIQVNFRSIQRYALAYAPTIGRTASEARLEILANMRPLPCH